MGKALTDINQAGIKTKTRIFAGAAIIAEQRHYDYSPSPADEVVYYHADPVTGSKKEVAQSGAEYKSEELEPLGQIVSAINFNFDPQNPPQNPPSYPGSVSEPEWQCQINWGGFDKKPEHCQRKALYEAGTTLPWEKDHDIKQIPAGIDSPMPKLPPGSTTETNPTSALAERHRAGVLKAMHKKTDEGSGKDGCKRKNGGWDCTVEVRAPEDDPVELHFSSQNSGV